MMLRADVAIVSALVALRTWALRLLVVVLTLITVIVAALGTRAALIARAVVLRTRVAALLHRWALTIHVRARALALAITEVLRTRVPLMIEVLRAWTTRLITIRCTFEALLGWACRHHAGAALSLAETFREALL